MLVTRRCPECGHEHHDVDVPAMPLLRGRVEAVPPAPCPECAKSDDTQA